MKIRKLLGLTAIIAAAATLGQPSWAHDHRHGRARVGVYIGAPISPFSPFYPWYYGPPPFYYPPVIAVPTTPPPPPVYVEQGNPPSPGYWYYCTNPPGYYPDIPECPSGWHQVSPQP